MGEQGPELIVPSQGGEVIPNKVWAKSGPYLTNLSPEQEMQFRKWVIENKVPYDINQPANAPGNIDYDMRGFYQAMMAGDPMAHSAIDPYDKRLHFTDYWKTPWHKTFSRESKYATQEAPYWKDNRYLIDKSGKILFDARGGQ